MSTIEMQNSSSGLNPRDFQETIEGKATDLFVLRNTKGMEVALTNYGCALLAIMVPDRKGKCANVILGHDSIGHVKNSPEPFLNTVIGRYANRIARGHFLLHGKEYRLDVNNVPNTLHGGNGGFHSRVWDVVRKDEGSITLRYLSPDGEEGFPGNLSVELVYSVDPDCNRLEMHYRAVSDQDTVVNLTHHGFFNLQGVSVLAPSILNHKLCINADYYLPIDSVAIPTGEILKVDGTPMDFRIPHAIGERIDAPFEQLRRGNGYDHCYVLRKAERGELSWAATCAEPTSGRTLAVYTTEPGMQLYTGNGLSGFCGAHGAVFPVRSAVCFEAQCFPDAPNHSYFPSSVLHSGKEYRQTTLYEFGIQE